MGKGELGSTWRESGPRLGWRVAVAALFSLLFLGCSDTDEVVASVEGSGTSQPADDTSAGSAPVAVGADAPPGCLDVDQGEGWISVTERLEVGLDGNLHWQAVRDLNGQATSGDGGLLLGEYVCMTQAAAQLVRDTVVEPELQEVISPEPAPGACGTPFSCVSWQPTKQLKIDELEEINEVRQAELAEQNSNASIELRSKACGAVLAERCDPCDEYAIGDWEALRNRYDTEHVDRGVGVTDWRVAAVYALADLERDANPAPVVVDHYRQFVADIRVSIDGADEVDLAILTAIEAELDASGGEGTE